MTFMTHTFLPLTLSEGNPLPRLDAPDFIGTRNRTEVDPENETNPFGQLVSLVEEHDALVADLATLRVKLNRAARYLKNDGSHASLGKAYFDRLKLKHSTILNQLRTNRHQARRFLQKLDSETRLN